MTDQKALRLKLASIDIALINGQSEILERIFFENDINEVLSQDSIALARAEGKAHLVIFLCTLATHNGIEPERAQHWLDIYQSLGQKTLSTALLKLSRHNVLRLTLDALIRKTPLTTKDLEKVKGNGLMWLDAIDLIIDHRDWSSAGVLLTHLGHRIEETQTWLNITKHLSHRHPLYVNQTGLQKVDIDYLSLAKLYHYCANAAKNAGLGHVSDAIRQLQSSALETAGDFDAAIKILESLLPKTNSQNVHVELARVKCKKGDLAGSIAHMDQALLKLNGPNQEAEILAEQFFEADKPVLPSSTTGKGFNTVAATRALGDLMRITQSNQLEVFLVSGTLLGCIRQGDFLGHDKDIDVGIVGWEKQYALCSALIQSGLFTFDAQFLKGKATHYLPIQHKSTGMWIDVFIYHPVGDQWVTGVDFFFGYRQTFSFTPFKLKTREFIGLDALTPLDAELNLTENFGAWQIPDPSYISHLESPSTDHKGALPFMLTARLTSYQAVVKKNAMKIHKVLDLMRQYQEYPASMPEDVLSHLSNIAKQITKELNTPASGEVQHV